MNMQVSLALLSCAAIGMVFMSIPPVLLRFKELFSLTSAEAAFLATSVVASHAIVQIPAGIVTDRLGARRTLIVSLGLIIVSSSLPAIRPSLCLMIFSRLLSGIGTGLAFNSGVKYASVHATDSSRAFVQGFFGGAFSLGGIPAYVLMPSLFDINPSLIFATTSLVTAVPFLGLLRFGKEVNDKVGMALKSLGKVFFLPPVWLIGVLHALFFGSFMTLATWFPGFAASHLGLGSWRGAGGWGSLLLLGSAIARITGGIYLRWLPSKVFLGLVLVLQGVSLAPLAWTKIPAVGIVCFGVALYLSSVTFGAVFNLCYRIVGPTYAGTGFGLLNFVANIGSTLFPVVFGWLIDLTNGYKASFVFMLCLCSAGIPCLRLLRKWEKAT